MRADEIVLLLGNDDLFALSATIHELHALHVARDEFDCGVMARVAGSLPSRCLGNGQVPAEHYQSIGFQCFVYLCLDRIFCLCLHSADDIVFVP
jgi:hypothetical protein